MFKIGLIADLAGPMAPYGTWARNGLDIALSEINSPAKQSASLHVLRRDARSDPRRALAAAEELIDEGVQALIVATASGTVLRMAPLCQRRQVVLFSPCILRIQNFGKKFDAPLASQRTPVIKKRQNKE